MNIQDIYQLAIEMGMKNDLRGENHVKRILERRKESLKALSEKEREYFDMELLTNPYPDSRILHIADGEREVKRVLVGIDIEPAEILLAKDIGNIDLIISHHPLGKALADLHEVMELQSDILSQYGVPINIAEGLMRERISEVARGINALNHQRTVDAAKIVGINLMCLHTVTDNLAANFLRSFIERENHLMTLRELIDLLYEIPEYQIAGKMGAGPKIFVGSPERRCGKIAVTEITGGTEPGPKIYEKMAIAGIGTILGMHMREENKKEAEAVHINVVIAGHMSSDSLGMNLFLDRLEKNGVEIIPCSGFIRVSRTKNVPSSP